MHTNYSNSPRSSVAGSIVQLVLPGISTYGTELRM